MYDALVFFVTQVLFIIAALMPILNPPGHAPIFLALTRDNTRDERRILARKVGIYSGGLLIAAFYIGGYVLRFFDVSLPIVQLCGGFLVTASAWNILNGKKENHPESSSTEQSTHAQRLSERAFYPLTFPITVGPGSITVAITVAANSYGRASGFESILFLVLASLVATVLISYSLYWCYRYADEMQTLFGSTGTHVLLRLSAFILMCVGIQIMWDGLSQLVVQFAQIHFPGIVYKPV